MLHDSVTAGDPARLAHEICGGGPRLVLVHGFTQTRRVWDALADPLATSHELVLVDAPRHGASRTIGAGLEEAGRLLLATGGVATYVGYSMGGRLCLHAALADGASRVRGLVLIGASPGLRSEAERTERIALDESWAELLESEGIDTFLDRWLAQPLFAQLPAERAALRERHRNDPLALAASLREAGTGTQAPLWEALRRLAMPVLVLAGERDERFSALGREMADTIGGNAEYRAVPRAGHALHLENPGGFLAAVVPWLQDNGL
ncbi:MAG: 2-succinyl-6-hydroxy-2,4-cyclohexadiene-1-carboxylate synthase [Acidimicrobiales bacterium]|nr:2-succinyl-6-hydroxy-2,4-cyclohexadiene-1-carboxylate synthase [Acidimicrobiales bacterium]